MPTVSLEDQEWALLMSIVAQAPWKDANPLLMRIGEQLKRQQRPPPPADVQSDEEAFKDRVRRNSGQEAGHG